MCLQLDVVQNIVLAKRGKCSLGEGQKKNYESLDICPNWVYPTPTYLVA